MCYFITLTIPQQADLGQLNDAAQRNGFHFSPITNAFVEQQLPPGAVYLEKDTGHCDCGTALGSLGVGPRAKPMPDERMVGEIAKRRAMGWSDKKIERWAASKQKADEQRNRREQERANENKPHAERWFRFLGACVLESRIPWIGVLLHFYRTNPTSENVEIEQTTRVSVDTMSVEALLQIEENVLYLFHA